MKKTITPKMDSRLVKRYIALDAEITSLQEKYEQMKSALRDAHARGERTDMLEFIESKDRFSPPWKALVDELTQKYMKPAERVRYNNSLRTRFKATPVAPTIKVIGKAKKPKVVSITEGTPAERKTKIAL